MDVELLRAFRRGDRAALDVVYHQCVDDVERMVRQGLRALGKLAAANLEDVMQEVFLRAFSDMARAGYDGVRPYGPYVLTIARHVLVDWAKRCGREIPMSDLLDPIANQRTRWDATELEGLGGYDRGQISVVARYLETLPPELGLVHQHRFVRAVSQEAAAEAMGITRQRLRTLEKRLVKGLRRALRQAGLGAPTAARAVEFSNPRAAVAGSKPGRGS
jgi:RNA polymerase sigma-70 factor (ECF subfamily)